MACAPISTAKGVRNNINGEKKNNLATTRD